MITRKILRFITVVLITAIASIPCRAQSVPAFPGAQGGGALSVGGRGGTVCEVINLNDSGPGSLRQCAESNSGPRTVVFRVGGTINLNTAIRVTNSYVTIAGQTAPGGGILLRGTALTDYAMILIYGHDVTIRYLRIRKGYNPNSPAGAQLGTGLFVSQNAYNVMLDHNSVSWTQDENLSVWGNSGTPHDITFSWNLVAEGLAGHATGLITGSNDVGVPDNMRNIDFLRNLVMNDTHRMPLMKNTTTRIVNNIFYNWGFYANQTVGGVNSDIIANYYKPGPLDPGNHEIQVFDGSSNEAPQGPPSVYVAGNKGPHNSDPAADNWPIVSRISSENGSETGPLSSAYRRTSPLSIAGIAVTADSVDTLESTVLLLAGASQRLACDGTWVSNKDAVDQRLLNEYQTLKGKIPTTEADVGGFPTIAGGTSCADTDHDGMPDVWETAKGLNPNDPTDGPRVGADAYTNLENYLNGASTTSVPPPLPPTNLTIIVN